MPGSGPVLTVGQPPIAVRVRRSARSRRLTLRLAAATGEATLTAPLRVREADLRRFLEDHEGWLRDRSAALPEPVRPEPGTVLPLRGRDVTILPGTGRRVSLDEAGLAVPGEGPVFRGRLLAWLKAMARDDLAAACDRHAGRLGRRYGDLVLRDTRGRWGSCSTAGRLMFSWRLVMAPPAVLDYVAAHEVAHLEEMNHSPRFWAVVQQLCPDHRTHRAWLRRGGPALHRFRFEE